MRNGKYCDMITWSVVKQRLGKHVSAKADMDAIIEGIDGNGVFYAVRNEEAV
jgi:hypothetical protein